MELKEVWRISLSELYDILKKSANSDGLPIMNSSQFISVTEKYGKEDVRRALAEYIEKEKPPFPVKIFNKEKVIKKFHRLKKHDWTKSISKRDKKDVLEKYDDYKYSYSKYGLGLINGPSTFNDVSNYFMQDLRLECGSYGFEAPKT